MTAGDSTCQLCGRFFSLTPLLPACFVFFVAFAECTADASEPPIPLSACAMLVSSPYQFRYFLGWYSPAPG